ncbi:MAG: hypothetical protein WKF30_11710 [Pyrinomonadaceae bacterium]
MINSANHQIVIILDFGSQYTQLIARRVREAGVYCEILPFFTSADELWKRKPVALILSGGPSSVYEDGAPQLEAELLKRASCPVLGICYGLQVIATELGGAVESSTRREYGYARLSLTGEPSVLFANLPARMDVG